jgi:hypothetical protein
MCSEPHRLPEPAEATLADYRAAQDAVWSRPEGECRVFNEEVVPDPDGRRTGDSVAFTDADGRRRVLHDSSHRVRRSAA